MYPKCIQAPDISPENSQIIQKERLNEYNPSSGPSSPIPTVKGSRSEPLKGRRARKLIEDRKDYQGFQSKNARESSSITRNNK
jgi:hypothetical protein